MHPPDFRAVGWRDATAKLNDSRLAPQAPSMETAMASWHACGLRQGWRRSARGESVVPVHLSQQQVERCGPLGFCRPDDSIVLEDGNELYRRNPIVADYLPKGRVQIIM